MIKNFIELSQVEIPASKKPIFKYNKKTDEYEQIGEINVVSWTDCLKALYANGAEKVIFENVPNENGGLLYLDENKTLTIKVFVDIDGDRREIFYPVINGTSDIKANKVVQSDIYNAKQRAFVKCVAVNWGLGISYWEKENPDEVPPPPKESFVEQFRYLLNTAVKQCGSIPEMLKHLNGVSEKKLNVLIEEAKLIDEISDILSEVLKNDKEPESK